ncbi:Adenylate kinase [Macleaya cordata]|uniref:adenylate kinase n=1 Tax=Macleaya cordata TaxID=56857 RepID=A0A200R4A0_MACCD|nr:Adenylate kinase [Macleaya cordata]
MAGICRLRTTYQHLVRQYLGLNQRRSFGAAALHVDYYYDDEEEDEYELYGDRRNQVVETAESKGSISGRGVQWVFIGNPSAKKHVYAEKLSKLLEVPHISMGSLVRQELNPRSSLYKQVANAVNQGKLVPEDIIFGLLSKRLEEGYHRGETGFILDGIPRTRIQAEILDQIADIDLVVNFKCMEECLLKKHLGSGICSHCQESIGMGSSISTSLNLQQQHTQLNSSQDDDTQMEKLRIYSEQRKPLEDYYKKQNKILDFQVASGVGETWQGLVAALHLQHVYAVHCSQKLTA